MMGSKVHARLICADLPWFLSAVADRGILLYDVVYYDDLTIEFSVSESQYRSLDRIANRYGDELKRGKTTGPGVYIRKLFARPVMILWLCILLLLSLWLPQRVLFISVEGNQELTELEIIQAAETCGIRFGVDRRKVRSENLKNELLQALPDLRWACINTNGCTAVITVQELEHKPEGIDSGCSSIYASRDGLILSGTVSSGFPCYRVGQAVRSGQLLVSGQQRDGILIRSVRSEAEIYALTNREIHVVLPRGAVKKGDVQETKTQYYLIIGKNRINLSKDSGISYTGCDKMYKQYYASLPGGFLLPVSLQIETTYLCSHTEDPDAPIGDLQTVGAAADTYLLQQTVSGTILDRKMDVSGLRNYDTVSFYYRCQEMIGRERIEELVIEHE